MILPYRNRNDRGGTNADLFFFVFHGNHVLSIFVFLQLFLSMLDMQGACSPKHVDVMSDFFQADPEDCDYFNCTG